MVYTNYSKGLILFNFLCQIPANIYPTIKLTTLCENISNSLEYLMKGLYTTVFRSHHAKIRPLLEFQTNILCEKSFCKKMPLPKNIALKGRRKMHLVGGWGK